MKSVTYASIFLVLFFSSCTENKSKMKPNNTFDLEHVKTHIREANRTYGERFTTNNLDWYRERYCVDACAMPEKMNAACGVEALINFYYSEGKNKDLKITIAEKEIYGTAEVVVEEGTYDFPDGSGGSFDHGKFIAIWKLENDRWKIYREIWNSSVVSNENETKPSN